MDNSNVPRFRVVGEECQLTCFGDFLNGSLLWSLIVLIPYIEVQKSPKTNEMMGVFIVIGLRQLADRITPCGNLDIGNQQKIGCHVSGTQVNHGSSCVKRNQATLTPLERVKD